MPKSIVKDILDKFEKEILSIILVKDKKTETLVVIFNDLAYPSAGERIKNFLEKNKKFSLLNLSDLWTIIFEKKREVINSILNSKIIYDSGLISVLSQIEKFKENLVSKFENYVLSIILFGSWSRGMQKKESDIDLAVVMDDTDLRDMTRVEAKQKLRDITSGIAKEVSDRLVVQVYLLTEFWEMVRDANPVIFTLLRDGIPFYDKGLFVPWKLLLKMGKIKPTPEAIESFIASGRLLKNTIESNLKELAAEKIYYMMLNPAQAALMFIGVPTSTPDETPILLERYFVKKKLLSKKYVDWLTQVIKLRKGIEHERIKDISLKEIDKYFQRAKKFTIKVERVLEKIRKEKMKEEIREIETIYKEGLRNALEGIGIKASENEIIRVFARNFVKKGFLPSEYLEVINYINSLKENYNRGVITEDEIRKAKMEVRDFASKISTMFEIQKLGKSGKCKLRFEYKNRIGEMWIFADEFYLIKDIKEPEKVFKGRLMKDGSFEGIEKARIEELNEERKKFSMVGEIAVKEKTIESLKSIFGRDLKIVLR
jgi:hypothetical protein